MDDNESNGPDEGSDPRKDVDEQAGKGREPEKHMTPHPQTKWGKKTMTRTMAEGDREADELEKAHQHADPRKGDKKVDGGDKVSTDDGEV